MKYIQANPDFYVIDTMCDEARNLVGVIKSPILAWAINEKGLLDPVTAEGIEKKYSILNPDGTITCPGFCQFENEMQYFQAMKSEL